MKMSNLTNSKKFFYATVLLVVLNLLASCSSGALSFDADLTLYSKERWKVQADILFSGIEMRVIGDQLDAVLHTQKSAWEALGVNVRMSAREQANGNVNYHITARGQGYDRLNLAFFDGQPAVTMNPENAEGEITFRYYPYGTFFGLALQRTFTISGVNALESNGLGQGNIVTWQNPSDEMIARLTLSSGPKLSVLVGGFIGAALILGGIFVARKTGGVKCTNCGFRMPRRAFTCPMCGVGRE